MAKYISYFLILGLFIPPQVQGYTFFQFMNTTSGFCQEYKGFKIAVGDTAYDDKRCERLVCRKGLLSGAGCWTSVAEGACRLVKGKGSYPDCCLQPKCD